MSMVAILTLHHKASLKRLNVSPFTFPRFGASFIIVPGSASGPFCSSTTRVYLLRSENGNMSADNCDGNVSVPLRNLLNSIQCISDRVRGKCDTGDVTQDK